jgi:hypothetical protein
MAKTIVFKTNKESWDRFIGRIETDIFGEQSMAYKVLKHLKRTNKNTNEINNIEDKKWIEHYKSLWCSNSPQNNNNPSSIREIGEISDELEQILKAMKNRKAASPDGLNSELSKYRRTRSLKPLKLTSVGEKDPFQKSGAKQELWGVTVFVTADAYVVFTWPCLSMSLTQRMGQP